MVINREVSGAGSVEGKECIGRGSGIHEEDRAKELTFGQLKNFAYPTIGNKANSAPNFEILSSDLPAVVRKLSGARFFLQRNRAKGPSDKNWRIQALGLARAGQLSHFPPELAELELAASCLHALLCQCLKVCLVSLRLDVLYPLLLFS